MRHLILHGHIFKNAGTTFDWSLRNNFGDGFLDHREDQLMLEQGRAHLAQLVNANPQLCAISSHHMTRDFPDLPDVQFLPVYFLRHPVARMRSVYNFERVQQAQTPGALAAKNKSFSEYVSWRMLDDVRPVIRNYQTRYLSGQHGLAGQDEVASRCFSEAVQTLQSACLVGVVERFEESMVVLEEELRRFYPEIDLSFIAQNVSSADALQDSDEAIVASVLAELEGVQKQVIDCNSFDLAIYRMANDRLQARIDSVEGFPARLQAFRSRRR